MGKGSRRVRESSTMTTPCPGRGSTRRTAAGRVRRRAAAAAVPLERVGRHAAEAPPGRTRAVGARRAGATGAEVPHAAVESCCRGDAPLPGLSASGGLKWGAVDNLPELVQTANAPPGEGGQGEGGGRQGGGAYVLRHSRRGPLVVWGMKKIRTSGTA